MGIDEGRGGKTHRNCKLDESVSDQRLEVTKPH
jgi:hypothetical protein